MINAGQYRVNLRTPADGSTLPVYKSGTRVDIALLFSALFLQRFSLPFGGTFLSMTLIISSLILLHQFLSGKLLIQFDRLLWFLAVVAMATSSLLLNFKSTMLTSYGIFLVLYSLVTLNRPSTPDRYRSTLQAFQFLVLIISYIAVVQFVAQFAVDARQVINFYGLVPDFLLAPTYEGPGPGGVTGMHTIIPITAGSSLLKSNGLFLYEPSALSQLTALGILIEVLEFRRPRHLFVMALGMLMAYSGSGLMLLLVCLPVFGLRNRGAALSALLVAIFAIGLFASGIIDLSVFLGRVDEFNDTHQSGFARFVAPFWLAADNFDTASLQALLLGNGPGTENLFASNTWHGAHGVTWIKLFFEYGIIGTFIFICFLASSFKNAISPRLLVPAIFFYYFFIDGMLLNPAFVTMAIVLCTLQVCAPRRSHIRDASPSGSYVVVGSGAD
jgi:hypothetical protein